ncbi:MAG: PAS domain-containing protein [Candidatus Omnitrophica bacterium]|nr:PAS domain-containing protein [Candidatus Omnitrophota bacterium]
MVTKTGRPKPVDRESEFLVNEIFFSTTDLVGNILSGNSVFVRVSQYDKEEIIGAPHNIIRHPDMPRVVFKVLWDYLKAKKPVVAYVKNMTKEGRYYWVLAAAFPTSNGYLSIRIKPTSEIFKLIPSVYEKLLTAEENGGMEASLTLLLDILKSKGFEDYDSFMSTILIEELNCRQKLIHDNQELIAGLSQLEAAPIQDRGARDLVSTLNDIKTLCSEVTSSFDCLFDDFGNLLSVEKTLKDTSVSVLSFSEQISILSLNVNINSYFAGEAGRTLSVVAKTIKNKTEEIESFTQAIVKLSRDISNHTQRLGFQTSTPRLQSAMINVFIQEVYDHALKRKVESDEIMDVKANILVLIELFTNTFSQLTNLLVPIGGKINDILDLITSINTSIYELERCNFLGNIEAAVIGEKGVKFNFTFSEIKESTSVTKQSLMDFRRYLCGIIETTQSIKNSNMKILQLVSSIKKTMDKLQVVA